MPDANLSDLTTLLARVERLEKELALAPEITLPILQLIGRTYFIEKQTRQTGAPPACRELIRRARVRPLADELHALILAARMTRQLNHDPLAEALTYAINQWPKFLVCLENGRLEIDNITWRKTKSDRPKSERKTISSSATSRPGPTTPCSTLCWPTAKPKAWTPKPI